MLGGQRAAQVLAGAVIALAPVVTGTFHWLETATFNLLAWALLLWLLVRILRTGDQRLWLVAGLTAGAGLLNSDLVAFLIAAVVAALAVAGPRAPLRSGWFYAGGAIAVALWVPYLVWQGRHGWPELTVAHSIASGQSGTSASWWLIVPGGKPYYLAAYVPVPLAAGAQPAVDWLRRGHRRRRAGLMAAALVLTVPELPVTLPILPVSAVRDTPIVALNYDAGETIGWPAFVAEIAAVYRSLPPAERRATTIVTANYGEAGALARFGPADGLPAAYSGYMAFWYWGPPPARSTTAILVGYQRSYVTFCGSAHVATHLNNHAGVNDDEQGAPVWICSQLTATWSAIWPGQKHFG